MNPLIHGGGGVLPEKVSEEAKIWKKKMRGRGGRDDDSPPRWGLGTRFSCLFAQAGGAPDPGCRFCSWPSEPAERSTRKQSSPPGRLGSAGVGWGRQSTARFPRELATRRKFSPDLDLVRRFEPIELIEKLEHRSLHFAVAVAGSRFHAGRSDAVDFVHEYDGRGMFPSRESRTTITSQTGKRIAPPECKEPQDTPGGE